MIDKAFETPKNPEPKIKPKDRLTAMERSDLNWKRKELAAQKKLSFFKKDKVRIAKLEKEINDLETRHYHSPSESTKTRVEPGDLWRMDVKDETKSQSYEITSRQKAIRTGTEPAKISQLQEEIEGFEGDRAATDERYFEGQAQSIADHKAKKGRIYDQIAEARKNNEIYIPPKKALWRRMLGL